MKRILIITMHSIVILLVYFVLSISLNGLAIASPLTYFEDDFLTNTTGDYTWTKGPECGSCTYTWDSANQEIDIRTNLTGGAGSSITAARNVSLPSSGYAKLNFRRVDAGPWQDRIAFSLYQDSNNYYKFVVSKGANDNKVEKVVGGVSTDINSGGDVINSNGDYTMEMWWSPTNLRLDINGVTIKDMTTSNTTVITPASFQFWVYRFHVDWKDLKIYSLCPAGQAGFQLNEPAGSASVADESGFIKGAVNNGAYTLPGDGYFHGDGISGNYITFANYDTCFQAAAAMTIEARINPTGIGTGDYITRIFDRASGGANYQMSVWRNVTSAEWTPYFQPPDNVASIALWTKPVDPHGGNLWKPVKTDYNTCPIESDHWYKVRAVWDSAKTGDIPGDIFVDDQGTDGNGTGENWANYINCTNSDQSQNPPESYLWEGDRIITADGDLRFGANVGSGNNNQFNGLIDWINWKPAADYFIDGDDDGIADDGDGSGTAGDNTCTGGMTVNCDDNCIDTPNPDQADIDGDGVGDICDSTLVELIYFTATSSQDAVLLEWETGIELDNAGFNIWRSELQDSGYAKINRFLVPAQGSGSYYSFTDADVIAGNTYYYKLEDIDLYGAGAFHETASVTVPYGIISITPEDGGVLAAGQPAAFEWVSGDFNKFRLQFSDSADFSTGLVTLPKDKWTKNKSYTPTGRQWKTIKLLGRNGKTVYWRVIGKDGDGNIGYSETRSFTIE